MIYDIITLYNDKQNERDNDTYNEIYLKNTISKIYFTKIRTLPDLPLNKYKAYHLFLF